MALAKIHPSNLIYISVCIVGVIAVFFVGIYPNIVSSAHIEEDLAQLHQEIQTQELMHPIYRKLIKEVQTTVPVELAVPQDTKLGRNKIDQVNKDFIRIAKEAGVTFESAAPDARSYLEETGRLTLNVTFGGDFFRFQKLLQGLAKLPYVASIDQLRIQTDANRKRLACKMQLFQE